MDGYIDKQMDRMDRKRVDVDRQIDGYVGRYTGRWVGG